jgi:hypothetical protein
MKTPLIALAGAALVCLAPATPATAQSAERARSLFQFDGASGYDPQASVITDRRGTIFGTTSIGGTGPCSGGAGCGTVFSLSPPAVRGGAWAFTKLYDFQGGQDGESPFAQLTLGPGGVLYGYPGGGTPGTVFRLSPPATPGNPWTFQILHVFTGKADGNLLGVSSPLIFRRGALYGVASGGAKACGQSGCGSVFRLKPGAGGGPWTLTSLFTFTGGATSGRPNGIVGFDDANPLYVSTSQGHGAVVELMPPANRGQWTESVITQFEGGDDAENPTNLVAGSDGALFGLAGKARAGVAFQLTPPGTPGSAWTRTTIATISDHGWGPVSLAAGEGGALIGAVGGDPDFFAGAAFQLTPPASGGAWTYTEVWDFDNGPDRNPQNVMVGRGGNLFGVLNGGDSSSGSLFELR